MAVQTGRFTLYNAGTPLRLAYETAETNYADFSISSGGDLTIAPTGGDTNVTGNLDVSGSLTVGTDIAYSELDLTGSVVDADISATAEIAVSKLADGAARQVLQTDAAGTGVEWTNSLDLPGTLDVTGAATLDTSLTIAGSTTVNGIIDDDTMATASDTTLATSESIKAYVDTQLTAEDLDFAGDSGTGAVDLDSQSLTIAGTTNQVSTSASGQTLTISLPSVVDLPGTLDVTGATTLDSTLTVSGDVSIADKIIHTGDTNTAIRFPAADTISFETAAAEAMRVTSDQRLYIGLTSPGGFTPYAKVHIQDAAGSDGNFIRLQNTTAAAAGNATAIDFWHKGTAWGDTRGAQIKAVTEDSYWADTAIVFSTNARSSWDPVTERMRITSSGNVGIGTTSPSTKLHLQDSGPVYIQMTDAADGAGRVGQNGTALTFGVDLSDGSTERMRIDSSGNVLINSTAALDATLFNNVEIGGNSSNPLGQPSLVIKANVGTADNYTGYLTFRRSAGTTDNSFTAVGINDRLGMIRWTGTDNANEVPAAELYAEVDGTSGTNDMPGRIIFATTPDGSATPSERMRITSGGEVYIAGTTDQGAYNLQCNGTGVWGQGAYVNGSDQRMKQNISELHDGLDIVMQLRPVTYQYKPEFSKDQSTQPGFIAQELQQALEGKPYRDGVVPEGPQYLNVAYQNLIPILVKAIQQLEAKVAQLENA